MTERLPFTGKLHNFLLREGFTHIQLRGIEPAPEISNGGGNEDEYILVPWKKGMVAFEDTDFMLEEINSTDITDMFGVEFGIIFLVEIPTEYVHKFQTLK